ncbi:FAD-dependent pyridine nucleotide-disulfide oxidoreductase [mine drainage metagenome]|uniref:FAD-dependent pyridine nucleotide-disulfide oxidoreductase n=1 Tax=mine drainage metagenome TaxID=410659 RepID=T0ZME9_9ZZZZ
MFQRTLRRLQANDRITYFRGQRVVDCDPCPALMIESGLGSARLTGGSLILAPGARELVLPFPGWTLPGVLGAAGLQALAKSGWPVRGRRVVLAGSGPLLLASARTLKQEGAHLLAIVEQASRREIVRFLAELPAWPAKAMQTLTFARALARTPYTTDAWIAEALGEERLEAVRIVRHGQSRVVPCDFLGTSLGLIPNVEAAARLSCALNGDLHPSVCVNAYQETSRPGIYAAGEITGIGGVEQARLEGAIAGYALAGDLQRARALAPRRAYWARFGACVSRHFAIRDPLRRLAGPETILCRCEDVTLGEIDAAAGCGSLKLLTRLAMGPCQGRICLAALAEVRPGYGTVTPSGTTRPPLFPARLETLAGQASEEPSS